MSEPRFVDYSDCHDLVSVGVAEARHSDGTAAVMLVLSILGDDGVRTFHVPIPLDMARSIAAQLNDAAAAGGSKSQS